jgi:AraC-like DNA-binding protein
MLAEIGLARLQIGDPNDARPRIAPMWATKVIHDEAAWRQPAIVGSTQFIERGAAASRWLDRNARATEQVADADDRRYVIGVALKPTTLTLCVGGATVHDGRVAAGLVQVSRPAEATQVTLAGSSDFLHFHLTQRFLAACVEERAPNARCNDIASGCSGFFRDPVIEKLALALVAADAQGGAYGALCADGIHLAIVGRLLDLGRGRADDTAARTSPLVAWRLKRAVDYIEAHLEHTVTLADVAAAAGLTRMHFAAGFRAATGLRPHEFLLRSRVERAQHMLTTSHAPIVDIALAVGFQTQAHFTSVFRRFAQCTPSQWRKAHLAPARLCN